MTQPWSNQAVSLIVIIAGGGFTGLFVYSPTPAAGNLIDSIAPAGGTDPYGNTYLSGITSYGPLPGGAVGAKEATSMTAGGLQIFTAPSFSGAYTGHTQLYYSLTGAPHIALTTPVVTDLVQLGGDLSGLAKITVNNQWPFATSGAALGPMQLMGQQLADFTTHTVTAATSTQLSTAFSVPASDAEVGAVYELEAYGNGTQGSTAQSLSFTHNFGGTDRVTTLIQSAFAGVNGPFAWRVVLRAACVTTGTSGTWQVLMYGFVSLNGGLGVGGSNTPAFVQTTGSGATITLSTTVSEALQVNALWGSTTGAPTLTCRSTQFRRVA